MLSTIAAISVPFSLACLCGAASKGGGAEQQGEDDRAGDDDDVEPEPGASVVGGDLGQRVVGIGDGERVRDDLERVRHMGACDEEAAEQQLWKVYVREDLQGADR